MIKHMNLGFGLLLSQSLLKKSKEIQTLFSSTSNSTSSKKLKGIDEEVEQRKGTLGSQARNLEPLIYL